MEIGQKVKWMMGAVLVKGVYIEEIDKEDSKVFIHQIGGQPVFREEIIKTSIIELCQ